MSRYAIVNNTNVENIVEWDGVSPYTLLPGRTLVLADDPKAEAGGTYVSNAFIKAASTITWAQIRERRNQLLDSSDWATMPDTSGSNANRLAWVQYRQLLKNIPQTYASPDLVVWPVAPAYIKTSAAAVQQYRIAATFGSFVSFAIPARCYIDKIILFNQTANAVNLKFGTTLGASDVIANIAVGANASVVVSDAQMLKSVFSLTQPQNIGIDAVTTWNGASIVGAVVYGQL